MEPDETSEVVTKKPHTLKNVIIITILVILTLLAAFFAYYYGFVRPKVIAGLGYNPNDPITMSVTSDSEKGHLLDSVAIDKLENISGVSAVSPILSYPAMFTAGDKQGDTIIYGVTPKYLGLENVSAEYGKSTFTSDDASEAIVSLRTIKSLGIDDPKSSLGKKYSFTLINIDSEGNIAERKELSLKVVGITKDDDLRYIYTPLEVVNLFDVKNYHKIKIEANNLKDLTAARKEVETLGYPTLSSADGYDMLLEQLKYPWTYYQLEYRYPGWFSSDKLDS